MPYLVQVIFCQCSDRLCPVHKAGYGHGSSCMDYATETLQRLDLSDIRMCEKCARYAKEVGTAYAH